METGPKSKRAADKEKIRQRNNEVLRDIRAKKIGAGVVVRVLVEKKAKDISDAEPQSEMIEGLVSNVNSYELGIERVDNDGARIPLHKIETIAVHESSWADLVRSSRRTR